MKKTFLKNIITGDESWFFFRYDHKFQYSKNRSDIKSIIKPNFSQKKAMISIFFCGSEFLLIDALPKGNKFNSTYFCDSILSKLENEIKKRRPKMGFKNMFIHMDKAKPHKSIMSTEKIKTLGLSIINQPLYSPDIAPCDFWLFGLLKEKLKGCSFETREEMILTISKILKEITKKEIYSVFNEWIKRLKTVINSKGEYRSK